MVGGFRPPLRGSGVRGAGIPRVALRFTLGYFRDLPPGDIPRGSLRFTLGCFRVLPPGDEVSS
jgi:hypothetical protein